MSRHDKVFSVSVSVQGHDLRCSPIDVDDVFLPHRLILLGLLSLTLNAVQSRDNRRVLTDFLDLGDHIRTFSTNFLTIQSHTLEARNLVVTIPKWPVDTDGFSQVLKRSNMTSSDKKIPRMINIFSWLSWLVLCLTVVK